MWVKLALLLVLLQNASSSRILGIIPTASYAHQVAFQPLWRELSRRGHKVTVITTHPQNNPSLTNLTEVNISFIYNIYRQYNISRILSDDSKGFLHKAPIIGDVLRIAQEEILKHEPVKGMIHNKDVKFDLVMGEALLPFMLAFGWRFQCPTIGIVSMDATVQFHDAMGNLAHPVINPDDNLPIENPDDMTFYERLISFSFLLITKTFFHFIIYPKNNLQARKHFGNEMPTLEELANNMSLLITTTHPIFHPIRPSNLNTITIGTGLHLGEPKPLPKAWQDFLDSCKQGVVYFSLGTNVDLAYGNPKTLYDILRALGSVPYQIVMRTNTTLPNLPNNVRTFTWTPQLEVLRHPNIKLFITQGGLQSLQETLIAGVPVVGIPFLGDQYKNVIRMAKWGYGIRLLRSQLTKETLIHSIEEVIGNPKYRQRAQELGQILLDNETPSLEKAIFWTEYVIRHKGARHLRSLAIGMPFWKFYMLDILACLGGVMLTLTFITFVIMKMLFRKIFPCKSTVKSKSTMKKD